MKNSKVIREEIAEVRGALDALQALASEGEGRDFTPEEDKTWEADIKRLSDLTEELTKVEKQEAVRAKAANLQAPVNFETQKENKEERKAKENFSFGKAVLAAYGEPVDGLEREMLQEGAKEMQSIGMTRGKNSIVIPQMVLNRAVAAENDTTGIEANSFTYGVYANTILSELGAKEFMTTTDQRFPVLPSVTTQWETEVSDAADGGNVLTKVDYTPKRLASYADYSIQAAMQHTESLEGALRTSFMEAIAAKVEYALFTDDSANGSYNYLANGKTALTNASITNLCLALIEEVKSNNHDSGALGFAMSNDVFSDVYTALLATGVSPLIANEMILGRLAKFSNQIADITNPAVYYGNWNKVQVVQFGGLDIRVDNVTQAVGGKDRLIINSFWDAGLVQDAAISVGTFG